MREANAPRYRHVQQGPWCVPLDAIGVLLLVIAWLVHDAPISAVALVVLAASAALMIVLGACFQQLTVADEGDRLAIHYGPLPLFGKRIRYADMRAAKLGRTTLLDSWGIHHSLCGGRVWNIWGRDCVVIDHGGKTSVGTDDGENLLRFLQAKLRREPLPRLPGPSICWAQAMRWSDE